MSEKMYLFSYFHFIYLSNKQKEMNAKFWVVDGKWYGYKINSMIISILNNIIKYADEIIVLILYDIMIFQIIWFNTKLYMKSKKAFPLHCNVRLVRSRDWYKFPNRSLVTFCTSTTLWVDWCCVKSFHIYSDNNSNPKIGHEIVVDHGFGLFLSESKIRLLLLVTTQSKLMAMIFPLFKAWAFIFRHLISIKK